MSTATSGPGGGRGGDGEEQVEVGLGDEVGGHHPADADDAGLAQAHRPAPAGEHDQRQGGHPEDQGGAHPVGLAGGGDQGHGQRRRRRRRPPAPPDRAGPRAARRPPPAAAGRSPVRDQEDSSAASARLRSRRRTSSATRMTAAKTTVVTACWDVFQRTIWSRTPSATPGGEGLRQRAHAGHHRRGQRRQQQRRPGGGVDGEALARGPEHDGEGGQPADDGPHQRREPADGDAEQQRPLGVLGDGPHGPSLVGAEQEPGQAGQHDGHDGHDEEVVAGQDERVDVDLDVGERRAEGRHQRRAPEQHRHQHLGAAEDLGQADGGHGQHQPGGWRSGG